MPNLEKVIRDFEEWEKETVEILNYHKDGEWKVGEKGLRNIRNALSLLKEHENENKRNPVIVCPHCGKRVK